MALAPSRPPGQRTRSYSQLSLSAREQSGTIRVSLAHVTASTPAKPATVTSIW